MLALDLRAVFTAARKNDQVLSLFQSLADTIVNGKLDEDLYLTEYLLGQTQNIGDNNESLRMIDASAMCSCGYRPQCRVNGDG